MQLLLLIVFYCIVFYLIVFYCNLGLLLSSATVQLCKRRFTNSIDWLIDWLIEGTGRGRSPFRPILAVPNVTAHPSMASVPITVLLYNGPSLCGFSVPIKGLSACGKCTIIITINYWIKFFKQIVIRKHASDVNKDFSPRTRTRTRTMIWVQGPGQGQGLEQKWSHQCEHSRHLN